MRRGSVICIALALILTVPLVACSPSAESGFSERPEDDRPLSEIDLERIEGDYPDWIVVSGFQSWSTATATLRHKERDVEFTVEYFTNSFGRPIINESVIREGAPFPEGRDSLLDYLEAAYAPEDKSISSIECESAGSVQVTWSREGETASDYLHYDEIENVWIGPGVDSPAGLKPDTWLADAVVQLKDPEYVSRLLEDSKHPEHGQYVNAHELPSGEWIVGTAVSEHDAGFNMTVVCDSTGAAYVDRTVHDCIGMNLGAMFHESQASDLEGLYAELAQTYRFEAYKQ